MHARCCRCHLEGAGAYYLLSFRGSWSLLSAVIQRERQLIICCHSEGAKRPKNPLVGSAGERQRTAPPLNGGFHGLRPLNDGGFGSPRPRCRTALPQTGGSPLREDDGGGNDPPASTLRRALLHSSASARHSEGAKRPKNPPNGSTMITTTYSKTLLSFSRSARESPGWLHRGNDNVLLCP